MKTTIPAGLVFLFIGAMIACSVPDVEGVLPPTGDQGATASSSSSGSAKNTAATTTTTRAPTNTTTPTATTQGVTTTSASSSSSGSSIVTTTAGSSTSSSSSSSSGATTTATAQPNCRNDADPTACLDCCEASNPGATPFEDSYGDCLDTCNDGDEGCFDTCFSDHISACQGSADCLANHACMAANNCLASNLCE